MSQQKKDRKNSETFPNQPNNDDPMEEALNQFLSQFPQGPFGLEKVPLDHSLGRINGKDLKTVINAPPYPRSIMEGFVVNCSDIQSASESEPTVLSPCGEITMGMSKVGRIPKGGALQVSTGSLIPPGDCTVLRFFDMERSGDKIYVKKALQPGENIELQGCDIKKGALLLPKGKRIDPSDISLLASQGILQITVAKSPKVAIFASGNEVISPTQKIKPGLIWDCNSYALAAYVREEGGIPFFKGIMKDNQKVFLNRLKKTLKEVQMVVIAGGTAVGGRDFIKEILDAAGKPGTLVNGVPMRSGKPLIMGVVSKKPIVCVAGHPPEALRGFSLFGTPALARLLGKKTL